MREFYNMVEFVDQQRDAASIQVLLQALATALKVCRWIYTIMRAAMQRKHLSIGLNIAIMHMVCKC